MFVFSDRLFVSSNDGGDAPGAHVEGGSSGCGATARWGGEAIVGESTMEGSSTSKNRPPHHKYKSPKQFELKQS